MSAAEIEPIGASTLFGHRIDLGRRFAKNLADQGEERGLIGPLELPRLWTRHILNSAIAAPLFHGSAADIGSGAGLPGLVIAIVRPDVKMTLVEPMERRVNWLNEQVTELGLDNVTVLRSRAEDVRTNEKFDVVTARAVSALRTLLPYTAPLVRDGGQLALLKGKNAEAEIDAAAKQIKKYKISDISIEVLGEGVVDETTRVVRAKVRAS